MIFTLTDEFSQMMLNGIRAYFGASPETQAYRWSQDESLSKIWIAESYPEARHRLPSIVVKGVVGDTQELSLSQAGGRLDNDEGEQVGESLTGFYNARVDFEVESDKDVDCKRIADLLVMGLVRDIRLGVIKDSTGNAYPMTPYVKVTGRSTRPYTDKDLIFWISLTQTWNITWYDELIYEDTLETARHTATLTG